MALTPRSIELLSEPLDPANVSQRDGFGSGKLSYLSGEYVTRRMNEIFGIGGWDTEVVQNPTIILPGVIQAVVTVTVNGWEAPVEGSLDRTKWTDSFSYTDVGVGRYTVKSDGKVSNDEVEKAIKESVTDALKRACFSLGDQFGLCLYDKFHPIHKQVGGAKSPSSASYQSSAPTTGAKKTLTDVPPPNDGTGYKCEGCGKGLVDTKTYTAAEQAGISAKQRDGKILCWACRNGNTK